MDKTIRLPAEAKSDDASCFAGGSSSGRTTDSDSVNPGSNPGPPANISHSLPRGPLHHSRHPLFEVPRVGTQLPLLISSMHRAVLHAPDILRRKNRVERTGDIALLFRV